MGLAAEAIRTTYSQEDLDRARREGREQGSTEATLSALFRSINGVEITLIDIQKTQSAGQAENRMLLERLNAHRQDIDDIKRRQDRQEGELVTKAELAEMLRPFQRLTDRVDNFLWQNFASALGGGGTAIAAGYLILKLAGVLR